MFPLNMYAIVLPLMFSHQEIVSNVFNFRAKSYFFTVLA